jgi:hypothetical protein
MKTLGFLAFLFAAAAVSIPSVSAQNSQQVRPLQEGGTRPMLISIFVPPVVNAPFTATVTTVWTTYSADGTAVTIKNHRTIARDSAGRIFQERRRFSPNGDKQETAITQLEFSNPASHEEHFCYPEAHVCEISDYWLMASTVEDSSADSVSAAAGVKIEGLGHDTIAGLYTVGTRETTTIAPGTIGNDHTLDVVREFWYSPQLGFRLALNRVDPRTGTANIRVTEIHLGEPDPKLFDPPADFTIVDARRPAAPSTN